MAEIRVRSGKKQEEFIKKVKKKSGAKTGSIPGKERIILKSLSYLNESPDCDKHVDGIIDTF